jgi:DNA-binding MarR family transcriptional regulator
LVKGAAPPLVPPDSVRRRYSEALPPTEALALDALFALRSSVQAVDNVVARWLGDDALTPGRWQILAVLWSHDQPVPQREIVEALKVSRANVSVLVGALQKESLVAAETDPDNGRQVLVALTNDGRTMADRLIRQTATNLRQSFALDNEELALLTRLIRRLLGLIIFHPRTCPRAWFTASDGSPSSVVPGGWNARHGPLPIAS